MGKTTTTAKVKAWPTPQDYNEAIQNPHHNLCDRELQHGKIDTSELGLPKPITGAFASVYRLQCKDKDYAVRCFLRDIPDTQWRYERISDFVQHDDLTYTVSFEFQPAGIKVAGLPYPILKMEWVPGETLDNYLRAHHNQLDWSPADTFKQMCLDLGKAGIAHGDLQHGNIIVRDKQLFLVDYDGMYVPSMKGSLSNELGHRNYQHPGRTPEAFGAYLDNFSAWAIYASLKALEIDPSLYERLGAGEDCLLFRRDDFHYPLDSCSFKTLEEHASDEIANLGRTIRYLLNVPITDVPPLDIALTSGAEPLPALNIDAPNNRDEERRRKAEDAQAILLPSAPPPVRRKLRAPAFGPKPQQRVMTTNNQASRTTTFRQSPLSMPEFQFGDIEPELLVPPPRKLNVLTSSYLQEMLANLKISVGLLILMSCILFISAAILGSGAVFFFSTICGIAMLFALTAVQWIASTDLNSREVVENGVPAIATIDKLDESSQCIYFSFTDVQGNRRTGYQRVNWQRFSKLKTGEKLTVLYNRGNGAGCVLYKFCGAKANGNGSPKVQFALPAWAIRINKVPSRPTLSAELQTALTQLRDAANVLKRGSASENQSTALQKSPAIPRRSSLVGRIEPELKAAVPRTLVEPEPPGGLLQALMLIAFFVLFMISFVSRSPVPFLLGLVILVLTAAMRQNIRPLDLGDEGLHERLLVKGTPTRGYIVGIRHDTKEGDTLEYVFEDDQGNRYWSKMSKIKAENTWVGREVTILYDPATFENMVYRFCTHHKLMKR